MSVMRPRRFLRLGAALTFGAGMVAAACGIDVLGSAPLPSAGNAEPDAAIGASVPPTCSTLDASCLGVLPARWQPVALGSPGCGADFTSTRLVENPQAAPGACACGACRPTNAFTCTGMTDIRGGNGCGDSPIAQAAPSTCTQANAQHLRGVPPVATGTVACVAANDAGSNVATTDPVTLCIPGCGADFCASTSACAMADGEQACPNGLTLHAHVGTSATPGCPECACEAGAPPACEGTVTAYDNGTCTGGGTVQTYVLDSCNVFPNGNYSSVRVKLAPPDAGCAPVPSPRPPVGDASLVGVKTICCR